MKKTARLSLLCAVAAALVALQGCETTKTLLPSVSGKAGEVLVIMDRPLWEGELGGEVRDVMAADCPYLSQKEPLYTLVNVLPSGFGDLFKVHRNIVIFNVSPQADSSYVIFKHDVWASTQCVIQLNADSQQSAKELFAQKSNLIMTSIEQAERDRVIGNSIKYEEYSIARKIEPVFHGSPHIPMGYVLRKITGDFAWIANDSQSVYQDILIYRYPVGGEENPFSLENIIAHRNEVMKANVPGMFEGTYMTTSKYFQPTAESIKYKGRQFVQTRGMWEVERDFMGGPFVSHSFYSPDGSEMIVLEAFVYAPEFDKRQYLRQVESILYSWEWARDREN